MATVLTSEGRPHRSRFQMNNAPCRTSPYGSLAIGGFVPSGSQMTFVVNGRSVVTNVP